MLHTRHLLCDSYYKPNVKSCMSQGPDCDYDKRNKLVFIKIRFSFTCKKWRIAEFSSDYGLISVLVLVSLIYLMFCTMNCSVWICPLFLYKVFRRNLWDKEVIRIRKRKGTNTNVKQKQNNNSSMILKFTNNPHVLLML